jgi:murein DD-endopeptidase MepM/ murein hydrolase activator NlpD
MLTLVGLFVAPLDNGQHQQNIIQTLHDAIAGGSFNSFNPLQQLAKHNAEFFNNLGNCAGTDIWRTCAATESGMLGTGQMQSPLPGAVITQPFANPEYQQWCGCWRPHTGIDLAMPYGTAVLAADSGQVIWTGWDWSGLGWAVKIYHGHSIATIYGHLARFVVSVGQGVTKGQVIAYEGSTGASTGPHLHFMVLVNNTWVDPTLYVPLP